MNMTLLRVTDCTLLKIIAVLVHVLKSETAIEVHDKLSPQLRNFKFFIATNLAVLTEKYVSFMHLIVGKETPTIEILETFDNETVLSMTYTPTEKVYLCVRHEMPRNILQYS